MGFPSTQLVKNLPAMQETVVWFIGGEDPLECIGYPLQYSWVCLVAQIVKNLPAVLETWVWSLDWEDPLATHSSILAWTEEPGGLQSMGSQRVICDWATKHSTTPTYYGMCYNRSSQEIQATWLLLQAEETNPQLKNIYWTPFLYVELWEIKTFKIQNCSSKITGGGLPGIPVVRASCLHCREHRLSQFWELKSGMLCDMAPLKSLENTLLYIK